MNRITQRDLHTNSSAVLRAAEAGEVCVVTVDGRPVATTLDPYRKRQWVSAETLKEILASPTDETVLEDIDAFDRADFEYPWDAV